ncbi:hypothetical protein GCM10009854_06230 [Saccharopolyspora halophila]|uniref:Uncharacterized protein n=1 Tax=Saccharopolyspora halophila TaxID=405551 RepID=A0ABP5SPF4_9PSEU
MRSLSRAVVVSALTLPLAFAGAGLASAGGGGHHDQGGHKHCVYYSCNSWWQATTTVNDQDVINAGIING